MYSISPSKPQQPKNKKKQKKQKIPRPCNRHRSPIGGPAQSALHNAQHDHHASKSPVCLVADPPRDTVSLRAWRRALFEYKYATAQFPHLITSPNHQGRPSQPISPPPFPKSHLPYPPPFQENPPKIPNHTAALAFPLRRVFA